MQFGSNKLFRLASAFLLTWLAIRLLLPLLSPFLFGAGLALAAEPVVRRMNTRLKLPRVVCTGIGVSIAFVLICAILLALCAFAVRELGRLAGSLPEMVAPVQSGIRGLQTWLFQLASHAPRDLQPVVKDKIASIFSSGTALLDQTVRYILGLAGNLLSHVPNSALTLGTAILSAYMISAKLPFLRRQLLHKIPRPRIQAFTASLHRIRKVLSGWILAQCKLMGITFLLLMLGLFLLRIPHAPVLAFVIALVDVLPILGTGTVLVPWSILCLLQGNAPQGIGLLGLYATVTLTRSGLEPKLLGHQLGIDPLLTLICLYAGFRLWGIGGMLLAPLIAVTTLQVLPETRN